MIKTQSVRMRWNETMWKNVASQTTDASRITVSVHHFTTSQSMSKLDQQQADRNNSHAFTISHSKAGMITIYMNLLCKIAVHVWQLLSRPKRLGTQWQHAESSQCLKKTSEKKGKNTHRLRSPSRSGTQESAKFLTLPRTTVTPGRGGGDTNEMSDSLCLNNNSSNVDGCHTLFVRGRACACACACVCVCVCVCVFVCFCVYACVHVCINACMRVYECVCECVWVCTCKCVYV